MNNGSLRERGLAAALSIGILVALLGAWFLATRPVARHNPYGIPSGNAEYQTLMGRSPGINASAHGFPTPGEFAYAAATTLQAPFHDHGAGDRGLGWQLGASLLRVLVGYGLAVLVAVPLGLLVGQSLVIRRGIDPFIQILRPISPLAWMPLALYTIKNAEACAIFVIFICALWPILMNTIFGVSRLRQEWQDVGRTLELSWHRRLTHLILPGAAPAILAGMRVGLGVAWLVIVAAEMLVGSSGVGYFVWNQWNNLSLANVLLAIIVIGLTGMALDRAFGWLERRVHYHD